MILVLARRSDEEAARLIGRWKSVPARQVTCEDLSVAGWRYRPGEVRGSRVVASGRVVPVEEIRGVLVRLSCVTPADLPHIVANDRAYVAAEMTAFLAAWLNDLRCPVLNRPTPACLWGPNWTTEQWAYAAMQSGLDLALQTEPSRRAGQRTPPVPSAPTVQVTVVGERCLGDVERPLMLAARRLARLAQVQLLGVHFTGSTSRACFVGATLRPELHTGEIGDAVRDHFQAACVAASRGRQPLELA